MQTFSYKLQAVTLKHQAYHARILSTTDTNAFDGQVASALRQWWQTANNDSDLMPIARSIVASKRPTLKLCEILEPNIFFDFCGQVGQGAPVMA